MHWGKSLERGTHTSQGMVVWASSDFWIPCVTPRKWPFNWFDRKYPLDPPVFWCVSSGWASQGADSDETVHPWDHVHILATLVLCFSLSSPWVSCLSQLQKIKPRGRERWQLYEEKCPERFQAILPKDDRACGNTAQGYIRRDRALVSPSPGLSLQQYLISALPNLSELGLIAQSVQRGDSSLCTDKLVSWIFVAKLGFTIARAGVKVGKSIRTQLTLDFGNGSNKTIVKNYPLLFKGAPQLFWIKRWIKV